MDGDDEGFAGTLVERSRAWGIATLILSVGPLFLIAAAQPGAEIGALVGALSTAATLALVPLLAWVTYLSARRTPVRLRETPEGLVVTSEKKTRLFARGSFRKGSSFETIGGQHVVDLRGWFGRSVRIEVARLELARVVLSASGTDRRAGTTRFAVERRSLVPALVAGLVVGVLMPASALVGLPGGVVSFVWLAAMVFATLVLLLAKRTTLTVGADGIELKPLVGRRRFIPHAEIKTVTSTRPPEGQLVSHGFEVTKTNGEVLRFDTRGERFRGGIWSTDPVRDAVARAWSAAHQRESAKAVVHQLASVGGSTKDWIAKLRALGTGDQRGDYRTPAIDERVLFDVVTDASADGELRAAAAVALGANAELAPRLRVVADDIADDRIRRVALAAVESEAEELLEEELEPLRARMRTR